MVCGFTGHRPQRLPWRFDEDDLRCSALKLRISQEISALVDRGATTFLCGMAWGCDFYFAQAVLAQKKTNPDLVLVGALPCPGQERLWPQEFQEEYARLCDGCDRLELISTSYYNGCMQLRNRWMVERADVMLTVYDGGSGGTASTVHHARKLGVELVPLWL